MTTIEVEVLSEWSSVWVCVSSFVMHVLISSLAHYMCMSVT